MPKNKNLKAPTSKKLKIFSPSYTQLRSKKVFDGTQSLDTPIQSVEEAQT